MGQATIAYADWVNPETGAITYRVTAATYKKPKDVKNPGKLICPHPGCDCELFHVPEHGILSSGSIRVTAHFARKPGQAHDRSSGCPYPNPGERADPTAVKRQGRLMEFLECKYPKILYMNGDLTHLDISLPAKALLPLQYMDGHLTAKKSRYEKTWSVKSATDLVKLAQHEDFRNEFYRNVTVKLGDYGVSFHDFFQTDLKKVFSIEAQRDRASLQGRPRFFHPIALELKPIPHTTKSNFQRDDGWYFMDCQPQTVRGEKFPDTGFQITPVLKTADPGLLAKLEDGRPYLVVGGVVDFNKDDVFETARRISNGQDANRLPLHILLNSAAQIAPLDRSRTSESNAVYAVKSNGANGHSNGHTDAQAGRLVTATLQENLATVPKNKEESGSIPLAFNTEKTIANQQVPETVFDSRDQGLLFDTFC